MVRVLRLLAAFVITHRLSTASMTDMRRFDPRPLFATHILPPFHTMGLSTQVISTLFGGVAAALFPPVVKVSLTSKNHLQLWASDPEAVEYLQGLQVVVSVIIWLVLNRSSLLFLLHSSPSPSRCPPRSRCHPQNSHNPSLFPFRTQFLNRPHRASPADPSATPRATRSPLPASNYARSTARPSLACPRT